MKRREKLKHLSTEFCSECNNEHAQKYVIEACPKCGHLVVACNACISINNQKCGDCSLANKFKE